MILLDANFLITLTEKSSDEAWIHSFLARIRQKQTVGIPAPSWAEFLAGAGNAASGLANAIRGKGSVQVIPFDEMAAIECGILDQEIKKLTGSKKGNSTAHWQKIKIDRQILAIASARRATAIYTDDDGLIADAALLGITTIRMSEVPRLPVQLPLLQNDKSTATDSPSTEPPEGSW